MGNSPKNVSAFTKNWRHVAPSLLRNQLTHELIQQHFLRFHNVDDQNLATQLLAKRIRLHHSHIVKLIYYAPQNQPCSCSALDKPYRTQVYTEYPGDCLIGFVRINTMPIKCKGCPCLSVLQGAVYLQQYYGSFEVAEDRVFLDLQQIHDKQPSVKVWIHPDKAQLHPRRPCTEEQMVESMLSLYEFIVGNGFCNSMTMDSLQSIKTPHKLADLKAELIKAHSTEFQDEGRHKKSFSAIESKSKLNFIGDRSIQSTQIRINSKPSSLPHQQNHIINQSKTISFNTNQKKVHFIHPSHTNQTKKKFEEIPVRKYEDKFNKRHEAVVSTQPTLQHIITPKGLNQHINEYQGIFKQQHQRVHFNYMSAESHNTDKKTLYPMKYEQMLRNIKEDSHNRDRINSNYEIHSKGTQFYKQNTLNIDNALRVIKQLQFRNGQPTITSQFYEEQLQPHYQKKQINNKHIANPPQSFSTNPQNTISNSQPSVLHTHPSVTNSQHTNAYQSIGQHAQINQMKSNESFQISQDGSSFAALEMQIPLRQNSLKDLPSYLPTTSRSPKRGRDCVNIHPISQVSEALDGKEGYVKINKVAFNDSMFSSKKSSRKPNASSGSKNQKIERYTKEIKEYQQNIRQRLSSSAGNKKFIGLVQNMLKPETRSDKPAEFKQTKSIYNDSDYKPMEASHQSIGLDTFLRPESKPPKKNRTQQSEEQKQVQEYEKELKMLYLKQQKYEREQMRRLEDQRQKQKEFEIQRLRQIASEQKKKMQAELERQAREKQQKLELQRDLECQRKNIQNEMNDLLRQNAMKDEYRSIREKVKQKKQTFAQLKAEAAKILEDCLY